MLYVQVNQLNKVVMSHTNPMNEVYGMGVKDQEIEVLHEKNQELEKRLERIERLLGGDEQ